MLDLNRNEPQCFKSFKIKNRPYRYAEDCDDNILRDCLRQALFDEQRSQCYYCEKKIEKSSKKVHIDHIKQRSYYHKLECEYSNLALSCNSKNHCGVYKDRQGIWKDNIFIDIFLEKPSEIFEYMNNGEIKAKISLPLKQKKRVENTIKYLNLNYIDLVETRKNIFYQLEQYREYGYEIDEIFIFFNEFKSIFKEIV